MGKLKEFLAEMASELGEECIYFRAEVGKILALHSVLRVGGSVRGCSLCVPQLFDSAPPCILARQRGLQTEGESAVRSSAVAEISEIVNGARSSSAL